MRSMVGTLSRVGRDIGSSISRVHNVAVGEYEEYTNEIDRLSTISNFMRYDINKDIQSPVKPNGMRAKDFFDMGGWL